MKSTTMRIDEKGDVYYPAEQGRNLYGHKGEWSRESESMFSGYWCSPAFTHWIPPGGQCVKFKGNLYMESPKPQGVGSPDIFSQAIDMN